MRELKYIIFLLPAGIKRAIVFSAMFSHHAIAQSTRIEGMKSGWKVYSAGFCSIKSYIPASRVDKQVTVEVYGESESLGLGSQFDDAMIIERTLSRTDLN